ncbi:MAG: hypothetical protein AAF732_02190 [Pseudomonadota bacterium]
MALFRARRKPVTLLAIANGVSEGRLVAFEPLPIRDPLAPNGCPSVVGATACMPLTTRLERVDGLLCMQI